MSYAQIRQIYGDGPILQYNALLSSIPKDWKRIICNGEDDCIMIGKYFLVAEQDRVANYVYNQIIVNTEPLNRRLQLLNRKLDCPIEIPDLLESFENVYRITKIAKYRSFQFKILNSIVTLNNRLYRMKVTSDNLCFFCKVGVGHFFWECNITQQYWSKVKDIAKHLMPNVEIVDWCHDDILLNRVHENVDHAP